MTLKKRIILVLVVVAIFFIPTMLLSTIAMTNPEGVANGLMSMDLNMLFGIMPTAITLIVLIGAGLIIWLGFGSTLKGMMNQGKNKKHLETNGKKKQATVLAIQDTGVTINNNNYYVRITVETEPGVQATFEMMVSRVSIPRVGDPIEILYDPTNPTVAAAA